ncbi:MAG: hypothetical protein R3293_00360 [Candidatus Promineifilaceae bacterium]|nr:hypothetical protein [Candidatus Promineifilaceae bacterium]
MKHIQLFIFINLIIYGGIYSLVSPAKGAQPSSEDRYATIEIRYYAPKAGKVEFVWGTDNWQPVPEEMHLEGTTIQDGVMLTSMRRRGESFLATIQVPVGANVQYGFRIKETADGQNVEVWDRGRDPGLMNSQIQPVLIAGYDKLFEVDAAIDPYSAIISQVFLYRHPGATQVTMVWGIDDWETVPEAAKAADTKIEGERMVTEMIHWGDNFQTSISVQEGSLVRFGFNYLEEESRAESESQQGYDGSYSLIAREDGALEIIDYQAADETDSATEDANIQLFALSSLLSRHWPILVVGALLGLGLIIGFNKSQI